MTPCIGDTGYYARLDKTGERVQCCRCKVLLMRVAYLPCDPIRIIGPGTPFAPPLVLQPPLFSGGSPPEQVKHQFTERERRWWREPTAGELEQFRFICVGPGRVQDPQGIWKLSRHAARRRARGEQPKFRRPFDIHPHNRQGFHADAESLRLPAKICCMRCNQLQWLDGQHLRILPLHSA